VVDPGSSDEPIPDEYGGRVLIPGARLLLLTVGAVAAGTIAAGLIASATGPQTEGANPPPAPPSPTAPVEERTPSAEPAPAGLPVIDYWTAPRGFPADPTPLSTTALTQGLRPTTSLVVYDAPGGRPRARLAPSMSDLPVIAPIVDRRTGWVAVLLPTVNRTVGWLPSGGWTTRPLPDQIVVRRRTHRLTWLHNGVRKADWTVTTGTAATPTPLGRTFVLGRTTPRGAVYAGLDALALASVPDDRRSVSAGLRGAHTGIHGWYRDDVFGRSVSNGCIRMPSAAQRTLLKNITPGTAVTVID
jgi:lipoprotein-anchoring transpeptidase ErfK/SrfK